MCMEGYEEKSEGNILKFENLKLDADYRKFRLSKLNTPEFSHL